MVPSQVVARVLIVEDEPKVARALQEGLNSERYEAVIEATGEGAYYRLNTERFDIVLLDLTLPGRDGLEILGTLRTGGIRTPVLILSARTDDRVRGLDCGADDYLVKPFHFDELLARVRALLRRSRYGTDLRLTVADLVVDSGTRRVMRGGRPVELTMREFELLEYLMRHSGQVVSRSTLMREVWRETARMTPLDNVIDVHIARLRRKVDTGHPHKVIHTIRGVGFKVSEADPWQAGAD